MLGEIDRDFYCSAGFYDDGFCRGFDHGCCKGIRDCDTGCQCRHRKHPTPEQFKEEYGFEWEGAVYWAYNDGLEWVADDCRNVELMENPSADFIVCACTPFVPSKDWRPE